MIAGVWLFALDMPAATLERLGGTLDPVELARAQALRRDRDRDRFVARHGLLRHLLARYLGRAAGDIGFTVNDFGKPAVEHGGSLEFSASSSGAIGLCVVARGVAVGCDIERRDATLADPAIARQLFAPREQRALAALPPERWLSGFFDCWTRKEAFVKAMGMGLNCPLDAFEVSLGPDASVRRPERGWTLHGFAPAPGYHAAIAAPAEGLRVPSARWFDPFGQEALSPPAASPELPAGGWSSGAARFPAESSISAALLSCAASSAVTPPTP